VLLQRQRVAMLRLALLQPAPQTGILCQAWTQIIHKQAQAFTQKSQKRRHQAASCYQGCVASRATQRRGQSQDRLAKNNDKAVFQAKQLQVNRSHTLLGRHGRCDVLTCSGARGTWHHGRN